MGFINHHILTKGYSPTIVIQSLSKKVAHLPSLLIISRMKALPFKEGFFMK
jgi:hypothetical protein